MTPVPVPRRRGPPTSLRIDTPAHNPQILLALPETSASALSSPTSDSDYSPLPSTKPKPLRNMKKLSLTLPSPQTSSTHSLHITTTQLPSQLDSPRRPSIMSLPSSTTTAKPPSVSLLHRKDEDGDDTVPYADGPIQIIPGVWLGSEDNARDWKCLIERGVKSILNVAKEVADPLDSPHPSQPLRAVVSTPDFKKTRNANSTYHPPNPASGRPGMHYLKLQWSHGQQDLVNVGFQAAMAFTDAALNRGEGVLVHCQCGISRSATLVIALVMRAAAEHSPSVPPEVWDLKGMQDAYSFVKGKSRWVGPNMSLIYQLLEYEKKLKSDAYSLSESDKSSVADEEEEWGRQRRMLDDVPSDGEDKLQNVFIMKEAEALDKAMEDRIVARKSSSSSLSSSSASGVGMGIVWRNRFVLTRKRAESIASNMTNGSLLSEGLVEEEEEDELLGVGGRFDVDRRLSLSAETTDSSVTNSPDDELEGKSSTITFTSTVVRPSICAPPSVPNYKTPVNVPPPLVTATRSNFNVPPLPANVIRSKINLASHPRKRRPVPIGILPPVPSSPVTVIVESASDSTPESTPLSPQWTSSLSLPPVRVRIESKRLTLPPLHLLKKPAQNMPEPSSLPARTPSQTLFVFPPSPTLRTRTPSTMTLTSHMSGPIPFPSLATPRVSTFRSHGRTRSFIGLGVPPTPTTAFSKVDARGYIGLE